MAQTPAPLVWDFYRQVGQRSAVGGVIDYYDTSAQSLSMSASGDYITVDGEDYLYPYIPALEFDRDAHDAAYNDIISRKYKLLSYDTDHTFVGSDGETHTIRLGWISDYHMITVDGVTKEISERYREEGVNPDHYYHGMYGTSDYHPQTGSFPEGTVSGFLFCKMQHTVLGYDCFGVMYVSIRVPYQSYAADLYLYWEALKNHDTYKPMITPLDTSFVSQDTTVDHGHWKDAIWDPSVSLDSSKYTSLDFDHPSKGAWYGVATLPGTPDKFYLLKYQYLLELGSLIKSGSWSAQVDNPICQLNVDLINPSDDFVNDDTSLFQIGSKMELYFQFGNSQEYQIGIAYIDQIDNEKLGDSISISGRNTIGFVLNDETFDENVTTTGEGKDLAEYVLNKFGITSYEVEPVNGPDDVVYDWKANTTGLSAIKDLETLYSSVYQLNAMWKMEELPDGKIIIGFDDFRYRYLPRNYYQFEGNKEVFSRKTQRSIDAVYSHVYCEGSDVNGEDLEPVLIPVSYRPSWNVGTHRTYHADKLESATQQQLERYAENFAEELANIGVKETFVSPIRPQLLVGDVGYIYYEEENGLPKDIGIITEVKHSFGADGFSTEFTLDSGGYRVYLGGNIISRSLSINGDTRKKRILDFIK